LETSSATHQTDKTSHSALEGAKWITENANSIDLIHGSLSLAININWFLDNFKFNIEFHRQVKTVSKVQFLSPFNIREIPCPTNNTGMNVSAGGIVKIVSVQSVRPNKGSPKDDKVIQPTKSQMYFTSNPSLNNFQN
jgi:hypothetical protein